MYFIKRCIYKNKYVRTQNTEAVGQKDDRQEQFWSTVHTEERTVLVESLNVGLKPKLAAFIGQKK